MARFSYDLDDEPRAHGAQGAVYFGERGDGLRVAVKTASSPRARSALRTEIAMLQALEHAGVDGVVPCLDVIEIGDQPGMVMPRYATTLAAWLDRTVHHPRPDTLWDVLDTCERLARTLAAVHRVDVGGQRIVHRDVKPENVFLDAAQQPFLGDFGGAMRVRGLREAELAVFGTPMWAPFDQILPGRAIPDPTWDTYALCVILYAGLTGSRPAYQADPRELLTPAGIELWETAQRAIEATGEHARTLRQAFQDARKGTSAADLVDATGRSALNQADRDSLRRALETHARRAAPPAGTVDLLERGLWRLLSRGLSPLSHPSPPNRFRDAGELADDLAELRDLATPADGAEPAEDTEASQAPEEPADEGGGFDPERLLAGPMGGVPDIPIDVEQEAPGEAGGWLAPALGAVFLAVLAAGAWLAWPRLFPTHRVLVADGLLMDRTEVTVNDWFATDLPLPDGNTDPDLPVVGLTLDEARAYCAAVGGRLPTEAEWRAAAGETLWPWGEAAPTCAHANAMGCGSTLRRPGGAPTDDGVLDLAGNAWEWVDEGVLLGGAATSGASQVGKRARLEPAKERPELAGARCVYDR